MKNFAIFAFAAGLMACGQNPDAAELSSHAGKRLPSVYSFSVDRRPVDGNFETITVQKDEFGTYNASLRVVTAGFGFPSTDTTEELGTGLSCVESKKGRALLKLKCSVDLRPADGELIELTLTRNTEGLYDATLRKATYGTLIGPATDVTNEIAFGLTYSR
ncbi:MAG TPA: hypothetical protein VFO10_28425 [Oligoflexus sp.]|uniref:hypothetical protein n=1 Tax=Oligoflexus sp. TaxID=1971216 RepID=UPI002D7F346B|nr:hypothetical protein [Oligoflexus sp.]HET9241224.1 hypothetical protein [Oligoflexus sp.]